MMQIKAEKHIIFCVDADANIGVGHAIRCLALMRALSRVNEQAKLNIALFTVAMPAHLVTLAESFNVTVRYLSPQERLNAVLQIQKSHSLAYVVVDGYHFSDSFLLSLKNVECKLVLFDDINDRKFIPANVVINACSDADLLGYEHNAPNADYLLGLEFAMINPALEHVTRVPFQQRKAITICFGGSDIHGMTIKVLSYLSKHLPAQHEYDIQVVTGSLVQDITQIAAICHANNFHHFIQPDNLGELLSHSLLAIAAPGNLVYELAYFNVPSLLVVVAENQKLSANFHQKLGWSLMYDAQDANVLSSLLQDMVALLWPSTIENGNAVKSLQDMHDNSLMVIDGNGATRLAKKLLEYQGV